MKKTKIYDILFVLLPAMAVALASTVDSVMVLDTAAGIAENYSYFTVFSDETMRMLPPLAATLCAVVTIFAVVAVLRKKEWSLFLVKVLSLAAAITAVLPIIMPQDGLLVMPNALLPLLMMAEFFLAYLQEKRNKMPESYKEKTAGPRLK